MQYSTFKNKLELNSKKSNSSDANNFLPVLISFFLHVKPDLSYSNLRVVRLSWGGTTDKLAINWQKFA